MVNYSIDNELFNCYKFFMDFTNFNEQSPGYGLTLDNTTKIDSCSIAASGFMLASLVIGVEHKWISYKVALKRVVKTLENYYYNIQHFNGFFVHFVDIKTGKRYKKCEYSTIDTNLLLNGIIVADSYFDHERVHELTNLILGRINWDQLLKYYGGKLVFKMSYNELKDGDYKEKMDENWIYQWHMYAEQLTMYIIAAGSDTISETQARELFNGFRRDKKETPNGAFVRCPTGSLFTYQFSHCWFDFNKYLDDTGFDWHHNSYLAVMDNYNFCKENYPKTLGKSGLWGVSASDGPKGYKCYGLPPYGYDDGLVEEALEVDGTISPYAILSSINFNEKLVLKTFNKLINDYPEMIGIYGLKDAINIEKKNVWMSKRFYGIDKGITLLMLENYKSQLIWKLFTNHPYVQKAIKKLGFIKKDNAND